MHTILLADGMRHLIDLQVSFLNRSAVEIHTAADGLETLKKAVQVRPHIIFLDPEMSKIRGVECCRLIKMNPELRHTPVIFVSAHEQRQEHLKAGCDDYLRLPVNQDQFLAEVMKFMPLKSRNDSRRPMTIEVRCVMNSRQLIAYSKDVSVSGLCLVTREPFMLGMSVDVEFSLPGSAAPLTIQATVQRQVKEEVGGKEVVTVGLAFQHLSPETAEAIAAFVGMRAAGGSASARSPAGPLPS